MTKHFSTFVFIAGLAVVSSLFWGTTAASAGDGVSRTNIDPVGCPAETVKTYTGKTGNKAEVRVSSACDAVWVRMNNKTDNSGIHVLIVGYDCDAGVASCRGGYKSRKMTKGGGWTYLLDVSDHKKFRVCTSQTNGVPFKWCGKPFKASHDANHGSWSGSLSRPEGNNLGTVANWSKSHVCARTTSGFGGAGLRLEMRAGKERSTDQWSVRAGGDYECHSINGSKITSATLRGCNGQFFGCTFSSERLFDR